MRFAQNPGDEPIRVLVADSTRIHTQLLSDALRRDRRLDVVGSVSHGRDLVGAAATQKIDVLVLSCNIDGQTGRGVELLRELHPSYPDIRFVLLLDSAERDLVLEAFRVGARGLFSRHESLETLSKCVRRVHEGQVWASAEQVGFAVDALAASPAARTATTAGMQTLSKRELDVVHGIVEGLTNRQIADRLSLSQHTIKNYLLRVFDKLGVSSRLELMSVALARVPSPPPAANVQHPPSYGNFDDCRRAAERGLPGAQEALAAMYAQGTGTDQDLVAAYAWYLLAEKTSLEQHETVSAARDRLFGSLSTQQLLDAKKLAMEYVSESTPQSDAEGAKGTAAGRDR